MNKIVKYISFFVTVLFIVCVATVIFLVCKTHELQTANGNMCIRSENGRNKCGISTYILPEYLEKIISKRYIEVKQQDTKLQHQFLKDKQVRLMSITDQSFWEARPAAKLIGKKLHDTVQNDINAEMVTVTEWDYGRNRDDHDAFLSQRVRYRNGRLVVPVDGTYFVYSLIDFFESCDLATGKPNVKDFNKSIKHAIYKFNILDKAETEIIANVQPHQIASNSFYNSYSSYVSSLAYLKAGDEISVKVSNITYLRYVKDNNFGLNLI